MMHFLAPIIHASISKIAEFLPSFGYVGSEVNALKKVTTNIKKPITCIVGGSRISIKIDTIIYF